MNFGHPVLIDRVELLGPQNEPHAEITLDGIDAHGSDAYRIDAHIQKVDVPEPANYRRLVTATVKAMGIDYLLTSGDGWLAKETHSDPAAWGLKKLAERGQSWLFEIQ